MLLIKKENSFRECSFPFYGYSLSIIELGYEGLNALFFCKETPFETPLISLSV